MYSMPSSPSEHTSRVRTSRSISFWSAAPTRVTIDDTTSRARPGPEAWRHKTETSRL